MVRHANKPAVVLVVDDSEADRLIVARALKNRHLLCEVVELADGEQLLLYLQREAPYQDLEKYPMPDLVLLDINMPRVDGKTALHKIRTELEMHSLPVVMVTTSDRDKDVIDSYKLGANAYVTKPVNADDFIEAIRNIKHFWLELVALPGEFWE